MDATRYVRGIEWKPRLYTASFTATVVAVWIIALSVLSRLPTLEGPVDVCIVCFVFAFTRAHRHHEVQKVYQTASTGRQQSRKAVGRTTPDDKARPSLFGTTILPCLDISDSQATKHHLDRTKRVMNKDVMLDLGCNTPLRSQRQSNWLAKIRHITPPRAGDCFTHQS